MSSVYVDSRDGDSMATMEKAVEMASNWSPLLRGLCIEDQG